MKRKGKKRGPWFQNGGRIEALFYKKRKKNLVCFLRAKGTLPRRGIRGKRIVGGKGKGGSPHFAQRKGRLVFRTEPQVEKDRKKKGGKEEPNWWVGGGRTGERPLMFTEFDPILRRGRHRGGRKW